MHRTGESLDSAARPKQTAPGRFDQRLGDIEGCCPDAVPDGEFDSAEISPP